MDDFKQPNLKSGVRSYNEYEQAMRLDAKLREHNIGAYHKYRRGVYVKSLLNSIGIGIVSTLVMLPFVVLVTYFNDLTETIPKVSAIYFVSFTLLSVASKTLLYLTSKTSKY